MFAVFVIDPEAAKALPPFIKAKLQKSTGFSWLVLPLNTPGDTGDVVAVSRILINTLDPASYRIGTNLTVSGALEPPASFNWQQAAQESEKGRGW